MSKRQVLQNISAQIHSFNRYLLVKGFFSAQGSVLEGRKPTFVLWKHVFQKDSWKGACRSQAAAETCEAAAGSPAGGGEGRPRGLGSWEKWVPLGGSPEGSRGWPHLHLLHIPLWTEYAGPSAKWKARKLSIISGWRQQNTDPSVGPSWAQGWVTAILASLFSPDPWKGFTQWHS